MKTMNYSALAVLAALVASTLVIGGAKSTRAETGGPAVKVQRKHKLKLAEVLARR